MTIHLKPITAAAIPAALEKAERYRLLNDAAAAESICLDVLEIDPTNQDALVSLLLSITDQFPDELTDSVRRARDVVPRLTDEYKRAYYTGIIHERRAKAILHRGALGAADVAAGVFREAMSWYERAEAIRSAGDDESILRWNTCARLIGRHRGTAPPVHFEPVLGE
jgi:tetratricopeptide (TPR) repeat protein